MEKSGFLHRLHIEKSRQSQERLQLPHPDAQSEHKTRLLNESPVLESKTGKLHPCLSPLQTYQ